MSDYVRVNLWEESVSYGETLGDGSLMGAIAKLNELAAEVPAERLPSVRFEFEDMDPYDGPSYSLRIWYERPKTTEELEAERAASVKHNEWLKTRQEARERQQLADLKAKYGE